MRWRLKFKNSVKSDFRQIDLLEAKKILKSLNDFVDNFSDEQERILLKSGIIKKLKGNLDGSYRLRLRTYRVIYKRNLEELIILVVRVGHRKDIYR